jgi:hypothetical protein
MIRTLIECAPDNSAVEAWVHELRQAGKWPHPETVRALIRRARNDREATRWIDELRDAGLWPHAETIRTLVLTAADLDTALQWVEELRGTALWPHRQVAQAVLSRRPSFPVARSVVAEFACADGYASAAEVVTEMGNLELDPNITSFITVIALAPTYEEARAWYKHALKVGVAAENGVVDSLIARAPDGALREVVGLAMAAGAPASQSRVAALRRRGIEDSVLEQWITDGLGSAADRQEGTTDALAQQ